MDYKQLSDKLTNLLGLPQPAVGIKLIKDDFIPEEHMYASFPGAMLEGIVESLQKISEKAMPRTRGKKAYKRLISV